MNHKNTISIAKIMVTLFGNSTEFNLAVNIIYM